jgi:steroid delta-isomerase-like uncharacterized protein
MSHAESRATLERVARRWIEELWRPGDLSTFDELHAPEFRDRSPAGRGDRRDDFRSMLAEFYAAFPDFHTVIDDLVVDESRATVAIRWSAHGTHRGAYLGVAPSGRGRAHRGALGRVGRHGPLRAARSLESARLDGRFPWRRHHRFSMLDR